MRRLRARQSRRSGKTRFSSADQILPLERARENRRTSRCRRAAGTRAGSAPPRRSAAGCPARRSRSTGASRAADPRSVSTIGSPTSIDVAVLMRRDRFCSAAGPSICHGSIPYVMHVAGGRRVRVVLHANERPLKTCQASPIRIRRRRSKHQAHLCARGRHAKRGEEADDRQRRGAERQPPRRHGWRLDDRQEQILRARIGRCDLERRERLVLRVAGFPSRRYASARSQRAPTGSRGPVASAVRNHRAAAAASPPASASRPSADERCGIERIEFRDALMDLQRASGIGGCAEQRRRADARRRRSCSRTRADLRAPRLRPMCRWRSGAA